MSYDYYKIQYKGSDGTTLFDAYLNIQLRNIDITPKVTTGSPASGGPTCDVIASICECSINSAGNISVVNSELLQYTGSIPLLNVVITEENIVKQVITCINSCILKNKTGIIIRPLLFTYISTTKTNMNVSATPAQLKFKVDI